MNPGPGVTLQHRYRIVAQLGQGGMGAVYRAWDTRLNVPVALKEMVPQPGLDSQTLTQMRSQFRQEATVLARMNHPHLVNVTDFFEEGGNVYLVMRFIDGESLADLITREGPQPEARVVLWAGQLLDALDYCHREGVLHRDIKPQNIIIRADGQAIFVDFGLVKLWNPDDPYTRTVMRGMGTPEYAPPEQYGTRSQHTDPRSDLYSLGATLYHALTARLPLSASDRMAMPERFQSPRQIIEGISPDVEAAILRAMSLPLDQRFDSAREMLSAIDHGDSAPAAPPVHGRAVPRRVWLWAVGVAAVLIVTGGALWATGAFAPATPPAGTRAPKATTALDSDVSGRTPTPASEGMLEATATPTSAGNEGSEQATPTASAPTVEGTAAPPTPAPTVSSPTLAATATATLVPTSTPQPVRTYKVLPLDAISNAPQGFASPPTGDVTLGGVLFRLTELVFQSQAEPPPHDTYPTRGRISANLPRAQRVHLLLTTGNGFNAYMNQKIGEVIAYCDGSAILVSELRLGQDVREWHGEPNVVSTAPRVVQVWTGEIAGAGVQGHVDMLSLTLPAQCQDGVLTGVELVDVSNQTVGSLDPAFSLTGVTVEVLQ